MTANEYITKINDAKAMGDIKAVHEIAVKDQSLTITDLYDIQLAANKKAIEIYNK